MVWVISLYRDLGRVRADAAAKVCAEELEHCETSDADQVSALHAADFRGSHFNQSSAGAP